VSTSIYNVWWLQPGLMTMYLTNQTYIYIYIYIYIRAVQKLIAINRIQN